MQYRQDKPKNKGMRGGVFLAFVGAAALPLHSF